MNNSLHQVAEYLYDLLPNDFFSEIISESEVFQYTFPDIVQVTRTELEKLDSMMTDSSLSENIVLEVAYMVEDFILKY